MTAVVIGVGPAKRQHAMAVLDEREEQLAQLQVPHSDDGCRETLRLGRRWPHRTSAVEGAGGVGAQPAQRLMADGEAVVVVPSQLSNWTRMFDRGHGRQAVMSPDHATDEDRAPRFHPSATRFSVVKYRLRVLCRCPG